ncbi:serine/threonine-protein kinase TBK1-like [Antedon mediterranea]|uniref:serine/threonine-protein kinase TBK1-like n=1 Tax=Antedon mediterranea TaxID=105859 RepID=UPI003AF5A152
MLSTSTGYIWSEKDVLGTGATSAVYTGRSKTRGHKVAVKVFNNSSFMRPGAVQDREFEVLKQLKHRNVVQLIAIDVDERSRQRVIVMELCSKGSLYTMLELPQFMFGVPEHEYKRVLSDICSGMKYLQNKQIVHRDLKPGNIMVMEGKDGQNIYKLADFGAARQLSNDENFVSLYGTEEYLHPDMYARALLSDSTGTGFNSSVDLWSLGVTLYHVATGNLPFRPHGGRNNKRTMHYLTTKKASGVICGYQKDSDGKITWERDLPESTRMSTMFKEMLTPLLAGLLECEQSKMMSADRFFEEVDKILNMEILHVFDVQKAKMMNIYLHKDDEFDVMSKHIEVLCNVTVSDQLLLFKRKPFKPKKRCKEFSNTTDASPVILYTMLHDQRSQSEPSILIPYKPCFPSMSSYSHPDADYIYSKTCAGVMAYTKEVVEDILNAQHQFKNAIENLGSHLFEELQQLKLKMSEVKVVTNLENLSKRLDFVHSLEDVLKMDTRMENKNDSMDVTEIEGLAKEIQEDHQKSSSIIDALLAEYENQIMLFELENILCYTTGNRCIERFQVHVNSVCEILEMFRENRRSKKRETSSILKLEKLHLKSLCDEANTQNDHCETKLKNIHSKFHDWFKSIPSMFGKIKTISEKVEWFNDKYSELNVNIKKVMKDLEKRQDILLSNFRSLKTKEFEKASSLSTGSSGSSGSQTSLASDFEVISNSSSIPEEEVPVDGGLLPFLQNRISGRKITLKKNLKKQIIEERNGTEALNESIKLMEALEKESASLFSTLKMPPAEDLKD